MKIDTTRFGPVEVDPLRIITLPRGMLGFPQHTQFALIVNTGSVNHYSRPDPEYLDRFPDGISGSSGLG